MSDPAGGFVRFSNGFVGATSAALGAEPPPPLTRAHGASTRLSRPALRAVQGALTFGVVHAAWSIHASHAAGGPGYLPVVGVSAVSMLFPLGVVAAGEKGATVAPRGSDVLIALVAMVCLFAPAMSRAFIPPSRPVPHVGTFGTICWVVMVFGMPLLAAAVTSPRGPGASRTVVTGEVV